jgi:hypothetical protein
LRDRTDGLQSRSDVPDEAAHKSTLLALSLLKGFTLKEQKKNLRNDCLGIADRAGGRTGVVGTHTAAMQ